MTQKMTIGGGVLADVMGLGKTHLYTSILAIGLGMTRTTGGHLEGGVQLVFVPLALVQYTIDELPGLPGQFRIWRYGTHVQPAEQRRSIISFGSLRQHALWQDPQRRADNIIVCRYTQCQNMGAAEGLLATLDGLAERIICDEAHWLRLCEFTVIGKIIRAFNARFRCLMTGTPFGNSLMDARGYAAMLERPLSSNPTHNHNINVNGTAFGARYYHVDECVRRRRREAPGAKPGNSAAENPILRETTTTGVQSVQFWKT